MYSYQSTTKAANKKLSRPTTLLESPPTIAVAAPVEEVVAACVTGPGVVTVTVVGGTVVPGMVVATSVVTVAAGVLEPTTAGGTVTVSAGIVLGRIVVPGMVVV